MCARKKIRLSDLLCPGSNQPRTQPKFKGPGNQEIGKGMTLIGNEDSNFESTFAQQVSGIFEVVTMVTTRVRLRSHRYMFQ